MEYSDKLAKQRAKDERRSANLNVNYGEDYSEVMRL